MTKYTRLMFVGIAAAVVATAAPGRAQVCGDVNGDGAVNSNDIVCLSAIVAAVTPPAACNPGPTCSPASDCNLFNDPAQPATPDNTDLAVLVDDFNGLETLHTPCASIGTSIQASCTGPADPETGLPTYSLGGAGDVTISASQIWPNTCTIILEDSVFVETTTPGTDPTTVLTIQAGTVIKGEAGNTIPVVPALFILPAAKISAIGTPASPIVFTSTAADGAKLKGDWGGLNINGRSIVNREAVGPCLNEAEGLPVPYGGCIETDSSGVAQFVRVEFAGLDFTPNNELNLFTMNAVGNGTQFNFIQAHAGDDDCIEWFGGTINQHHLVASGCADDGFDSQLGFQGSLQYGLMVQNGLLTDTTPSRDSRGIEADNSEFNNIASPRTEADYCNLTIVGARGQAVENGGSDAGILFRRGVAGMVANSIVTGFQDAGMEIRDEATFDRACDGSLNMDSNLFFENGDFPGAGTEHCKGTGVCISACAWYDAEPDISPSGANDCDPGISGDTYPATDTPDYRPSFSGSNCPTATSCSAINELFEDTGYIGAFDPGAPIWLSTPWNNFDPDGNAYP